jgi:hypothetical protein
VSIRPAALLSAVVAAGAFAAATAAYADVTTYHGDALRTGWFSNETALNTSNVNASSFGLLKTVVLDGRVDAEPLFLSNQAIDGQGTHDVVYVATENNSVYALDAAAGTILWQRNFGAPVPDSYKDGDDNVYPVMGILGTPTIDRTLNALFVVADTFINSSSDVFTLHSIALNNGSDNVTPTPISATARIQGGARWVFNSQYQLQRAGLLESGGSIYVTFGSNGDMNPNISRGTILRYGATTLAPENLHLTDRLKEHRSSPGPFYLTSIWQSGYAPASDAQGNIYFSTGNSDWYTPTYGPLNRPESIVKLNGDLMNMLSSFTPSNYFSLDNNDEDVGSGGFMLLPTQRGAFKHLAVAGGKDGRLFLMNADKLGGFTPSGPDHVLETVSQGGCWCGPAYYLGADGGARVVTGGGNGVTSWRLAEGRPPTLTAEGSTGSGSVQGLPDDGGTFPVVSSNGTTSGTAIVWFVQRPQKSQDGEPGTPVVLQAYDLTNLTQPLFSAQAGTWRHAVNSNANIVPTVAGGKVYVASNEQLQIFGLLSQSRRRTR